MGLPVVYRKSGEGAIASYNYTDIAEGTGVVKFMGCIDMDGNGFLTTNTISSHTAYTSYANGVGAGNMLNKDFQVTFNSPRIINGTALCNIPFAGSSGNARNRQATITIYKISDGVSTTLGTDSGADATNSSSATLEKDEMVLIKIPITKTHFKKDDILKINVTSVRTDTGGVDEIGHDPASRVGSYLTNSQMAFYIPFDLDL